MDPDFYDNIGHMEIQKAINDQDVAPNEASNTLKELIRDLMRKCWNATRFIEGGRVGGQPGDTARSKSDNASFSIP